MGSGKMLFLPAVEKEKGGVQGADLLIQVSPPGDWVCRQNRVKISGLWVQYPADPRYNPLTDFPAGDVRMI